MDDITKYIMEQEEVNEMLDKVTHDLQELTTSGDPFGGLTIRLNQADSRVASLALAAAIIYASYKAIKGLQKFAQAKRCRQYKYGSPAGKVCENKVLIEKFNKQVEILKSKVGLCSHAKDRQKCTGKIQKKIGELQQKVKEKQVRIKELEHKL
jgi:hypothetical protein